MTLVNRSRSGSDASAEHAGSATLWWAVVAIAVLLCAGTMLVPEDSATQRTALSAASDLMGAVAIAVGVRRCRPRVPAAWLLLVAGLIAWLVGIWGLYLAADEQPSPSWADLIYPLLAAGSRPSPRSPPCGPTRPGSPNRWTT